MGWRVGACEIILNFIPDFISWSFKLIGAFRGVVISLLDFCGGSSLLLDYGHILRLLLSHGKFGGVVIASYWCYLFTTNNIGEKGEEMTIKSEMEELIPPCFVYL